MKKFIIPTVVVALVAVIAVSVFKIMDINAMDKVETPTEFIDDSFTEVTLDENLEAVSVETKEMTAFNNYLLMNSNTVGVLSIASLNEEPVVNTENQNEYLYKNIRGEKGSEGTLFSASKSDFLRSDVTTVFGHNMKNGNKFGCLKNYKSLDYVKSNPTFSAENADGKVSLKIVAVADVSSDYKANGWYYANPNFADTKSFEKFEKEVRTRSFFVIPDRFTQNDKYVILSTCDYGFEGERLIVVARIMDENETVDTSAYRTNNVVVRATEYYSTTGKTAPTESAVTSNFEANYR